MTIKQYPHLHDTTVEKLSLSDAERITDIRTGYWISYPKAKEIINDLEVMFHHPKIQRMPCRFIESATNNGKSRIIGHFMEKHPAEDNIHGEWITLPILFVETPKSARDCDLYDEILRAINAPFRASASDSAKYGLIAEYTNKLKVQILILDEIHNIIVARNDLQRAFLYTLKKLNNGLQIPLVAVGAKEALRAFQSSKEIENRFVPIPLPYWVNDKNYLRLLKSFESKIPLRKPSHLVETTLANKILSYSQGTIGEIYRLLSEAAILAIEGKEERITEKLIDKASVNSPAERKKRTRI